MSVGLEQALVELKKNNVVAIPTETVYGLAARIDSDEAIEKIFSTKQRPFFDPLIVHVHDVTQAQGLVGEWPKAASILAQNFWPGPLTLVLKKNKQVSDLITSGLATVGLRMPRHPLTLELLRDLKVPLAAPSANRFGKTSPTQAEHVKKELPGVFVLDGGDCEVGIESTIVLVESVNSVTVNLKLLRPGMIHSDVISEALQKNKINFVWQKAEDKLEAPGQMKHHYMPEEPLVIVENSSLSREELLLQINQKIIQAPDSVDGIRIKKPSVPIRQTIQLELGNSVAMAARKLYSELRLCSEQKPDCILFFKQAWHSSPEWSPIFDRLNKAATLII